MANLSRRRVLLGLQASAVATLACRQPAHAGPRTIHPSGDPSGRADTQAIQAALGAGQTAMLLPGASYRLAKRVVVRHGGTGVVCPQGTARLLMLTGQGQFDLSTYEPREHFGERHVGILAQGIERPLLGGLDIRMQPSRPDEVRVCIPIALRGCSQLEVGSVEMAGFRESWRAMFTLDSCHGGRVRRIFAHDCNPDTDVLPSLQLTAVCLDDNRTDGSSCRDITFDRVEYRNLLLGRRALAKYGPQSDAVTVMSGGDTGLVFGLITGDGVGEALDCWGDRVTANLDVRNTQLYPVKLLYGASHNHITARIDGTGLSAVYLGGTRALPERTPHGCNDNHIEVHARRVGALNPTVRPLSAGMPPTQPGIYFDNSSTFDPSDNVITGDIQGAPGANMRWVVAGSTNGAGNRITVSGGGFTESFSHWMAGARAPTIVQLRK